jgi:glycosyltransferase involved in cell wall biosynthesis
LRVLIVITKGELGGAQTHVLELCRALRRQCDFRVMLGGAAQSPLARELRAIDVPVENVPGMSNEISVRSVISSVRQVAATARNWEADLIHVHSAVASGIGRIAGVLAARPVVYTVHGFGFKPEVALKRRCAAYLAERLLVPLTAKYICVSEAERQLARRLGVPQDEVSVIANGLGDSPWRADPQVGEPVIVMVARAVSPKRHDLLLRALAVMQQNGIEPPRTVLAGSGPLLDAAESMAKSLGLARVSFLGDVEQVPELLARSHIFVLLSDHEGQPISIIEAMRAGLPIVASDLPGIRTQVTDGVEGLLTPNEPVEIAKAIGQLVQDQELRTRIGAAARRKYERAFSVAGMAGDLKLLYDSFAEPVAAEVRPPVM